MGLRDLSSRPASLLRNTEVSQAPTHLAGRLLQRRQLKMGELGGKAKKGLRRILSAGKGGLVGLSDSMRGRRKSTDKSVDLDTSMEETATATSPSPDSRAQRRFSGGGIANSGKKQAPRYPPSQRESIGFDVWSTAPAPAPARGRGQELGQGSGTGTVKPPAHRKRCSNSMLLDRRPSAERRSSLTNEKVPSPSKIDLVEVARRFSEERPEGTTDKAAAFRRSTIAAHSSHRRSNSSLPRSADSSQVRTPMATPPTSAGSSPLPDEQQQRPAEERGRPTHRHRRSLSSMLFKGKDRSTSTNASHSPSPFLVRSVSPTPTSFEPSMRPPLRTALSVSSHARAGRSRHLRHASSFNVRASGASAAPPSSELNRTGSHQLMRSVSPAELVPGTGQHRRRGSVAFRHSRRNQSMACGAGGFGGTGGLEALARGGGGLEALARGGGFPDPAEEEADAEAAAAIARLNGGMFEGGGSVPPSAGRPQHSRTLTRTFSRENLRDNLSMSKRQRRQSGLSSNMLSGSRHRGGQGYADSVEETETPRPDAFDCLQGFSTQYEPETSEYSFVTHTFGCASGFGGLTIAQDKSTQQSYVVKAFDKGVLRTADEETIQKISESIQVERSVLETASHAFVVTSKQTMQDAKFLYFVLDFTGGEHLQTCLDREGRFSEASASFLAAEIVCGISHLQGMGIAYRDLRPENVLLAQDGHVKLSEFSSCKAQVDPLYGAFTIVGEDPYTAPELHYGRKGHGLAVDWWSLGVLIYVMLTGKLPMPTVNVPDLDEQLEKTLDHIPEYVSSNSSCIMMELLSTDPKSRLGSNSPKDVKDHIFFGHLDWSLLELRGYQAPFSAPDSSLPSLLASKKQLT